MATDLLNRLAQEGQTVLLWQPLGELVNQLTRWLHQKQLDRADLVRFTEQIQRMFPLVMPTPAVLDRALDLAGRYSLSHWDSMLLAACLEAGIETLYTEDIGAPRKIDALALVNPFLESDG